MVELGEIEKIANATTWKLFHESKQWRVRLCFEDVLDIRQEILARLILIDGLLPSRYFWKAARNTGLKAAFRLIRQQIPLPVVKESDDFMTSHAHEIVELLVAIRSKKGDRGKNAATRDFQILLLAANGWSNKEIGQELGINPESVKKYRQNIFKRLKVQNNCRYGDR